MTRRASLRSLITSRRRSSPAECLFVLRQHSGIVDDDGCELLAMLFATRLVCLAILIDGFWYLILLVFLEGSNGFLKKFIRIVEREKVSNDEHFSWSYGDAVQKGHTHLKTRMSRRMKDASMIQWADRMRRVGPRQVKHMRVPHSPHVSTFGGKDSIPGSY